MDESKSIHEETLNHNYKINDYDSEHPFNEDT